MAEKKNILPSVLMIIISILGILFGLLSAGINAADILVSINNGFPLNISSLSTIMLSLCISALNIPSLVLFIRKARGKPLRQHKARLFKPASLALAGWGVLLGIGYFFSQKDSMQNWLAPLTIAVIIIPIWWLVEFFRRGLPRSTSSREWGTLTIGLTIAPVLIIIAEIIFILVLVIGIILLINANMGGGLDITSLIGNLDLLGGGIEQLEGILYEIMQQPAIAGAVFLMVGLAAPLIEEVFKPMATWFLLNRPLKVYEGYALGLISGGAFAMLESTGIVIQMEAVDWLAAVILRAATGVLHIGLSGIVGYGFARSVKESTLKHGGVASLVAVFLHGAWNSLALFSGLSSFNNTNGIGAYSIIAFICMAIVFIAIVTINFLIHRYLRKAALSDKMSAVASTDEEPTKETQVNSGI